MRGFASAAAPKTDPNAGKEYVFVPSHPNDRPDTDTASVRGYAWVSPAEAKAARDALTPKMV